MWLEYRLVGLEQKANKNKKCHVQGGNSEKTQNIAEKFRTR